MTQSISTKYLIKTGNYFQDVVDNIISVIDREIKEDTEQKFTYIDRRVQIFDHDVITVPTTPAIAVAFRGWEKEDIRTIGKQNVTDQFDITVDVRYYHQILDRNTNYKDIVLALWELARILRRNSDLNGLSPMGAVLNGGQVETRPRWNNIYAGGLIVLTVPIAIQTRRGIS